MLLLTILSELIVAVTTPNDRLAILPVAVADSPYELAKMRHVTVYPILQALNPAYRKSGKSKYKKVWISWKDEDGKQKRTNPA